MVILYIGIIVIGVFGSQSALLPEASLVLLNMDMEAITLLPLSGMNPAGKKKLPGYSKPCLPKEFRLC
jgi:hypothetical protein